MKVYLSNFAGKPLTEYLEKQGYKLHFMTGENTPVYDAIKTHADIHMCRLGIWENPVIFPGNPEKLHSCYPGNIIYNAVCTDKYFIHNLKHTAPDLLAAARKWKSARNSSADDLVLVDVPQGYTRCCCLPVDDASFITADHGIAKELKFVGADVLLIEKGHILLPGFDYGFIGGCAGHITPHTIVFNGDLSAHPSFVAIKTFIQDRNIDIVFFREYPLTDIGSILTSS